MSSNFGPRAGNQMYRICPVYKESLERIAGQLDTAVKYCCPTMVQPYNQVAVLAIRWKDDDIGVDGLERELLDELRNRWNFTTENYVIPDGTYSVTVHIEFMERIFAFKKKYDHPDTLMIIVYSGHGMISDDYKKYYISGKLVPDPLRPGSMRLGYDKIDFFEVDFLLRRDLKADACYIFDSCFAASLALNTAGEVEILAASGLWEIAGADLATSFTRRLIDILGSKKASTSLGEIFGQMAANHPRKQLKAMPIYFPRQDKPQIQLTPVRPTGQYFQFPDAAPLSQRIARLKSLPADGPRVLVSVQLQDSVTLPDLEQWKRWLTRDIPSNISSISIEAIFESTSQMLLLTMPFQIWSMLPTNDTAWSYVGIVNSNNRIFELRQQSQRQAAALSQPLAIRTSTPSGPENVRPGSSSGQGHGGVGRGGPGDDPSNRGGK